MVCEKIKSAVLKFFTGREEPDRPSRVEEIGKVRKPVPVVKKKEMSLYYPEAVNYTYGSKTRGKYPHGYPLGAIIHYTASHGSLEGEVHFAQERGYNYFVINKQGTVAQMAPLDQWGYHAGKSSAPELKGYVSRYLVGIEVICAGQLDRVPGTEIFKTWWGEQVEKDYIKTKRYTSRRGKQLEGYEKFTDMQEKSLLDLIMWLKFNNPGIFSLQRVYGHNEVSPGRKVDPGLSINAPSMKAYRNFLETIYRNRTPSNKLV